MRHTHVVPSSTPTRDPASGRAVGRGMDPDDNEYRWVLAGAAMLTQAGRRAERPKLHAGASMGGRIFLPFFVRPQVRLSAGDLKTDSPVKRNLVPGIAGF